jgi:Zn-dependent protease
VADYIFPFLILIFSVVIHEVAHGSVAYALGDPTAQKLGRLTLNPIPHIDPFGSVILPLLQLISLQGVFFAWAKPVPYNPYNLRNQRWGPVLVGLAGPLSNLLVAAVFGLFFRFYMLSNIGVEGILGETNAFASIVFLIIFINLSLAIFNLLPIPPLDGSHLFLSLLPYQWYNVRYQIERYGFVILIAILFLLPNLISLIISPAIAFLVRALTGLSL